ncbi:MAG: hypothetical protein Q8K12_13825 [Thiobacillus sp.]|nr:hypothetical protein [Thiobacillus sp.]
MCVEYFVQPRLRADTLTGGAGGDSFVYTSMRDAGDTIVDFTPYADRIQLGGLLASLGYSAATRWPTATCA